MLKMLPLFSSSKGNSTYIESENTSLLVDLGVSCKRIVDALTENKINPASIEAILITHEHSDHIKGIKVFANKYSIPVFATEKTWTKLDSLEISESYKNTFTPDKDFTIGDITVSPFSTPHDAIDPCGFSFYKGKDKVTIATDLGHINDYLLSKMIESNKILLESNHDIDMLRTGPYPWQLKQRILGNFGHLSNALTAKTVEYLIKNGTKDFVLGHLSEENNFPELALETVRSRLKMQDINISDISLSVAKP
ncbi:MAG: MBL fold metallo-hydrolase [Clostridia bacterium]|nr:MBL fold metallo-hydrolase [Clostridia bacterium]